jgi:glycerophosphoryl diester phosphodiesterase
MRLVVRAAAFLLAAITGFILWLVLPEPSYPGRLVPRSARTLVFAHRGFGDYAPDNSLHAVEKAMAAGMDGVDVDGQFTRDGELVIYHDLSVDRLTAGTGKVRDKTTEEMLALDLGPRHDSAVVGAFVRRFEDFVVAVKGRGILMVELKVPGLAETGIEARAVEIIRKYTAHADVVLSSFNPFVLRRLKQLDPEVRTALIFMDTNWNPELLAEIRPEDRVDLPWVLRQEWIRRAFRKVVKPDLLSINHEVDPRVTDRLIAKGWPVFIWTIDDELAIRAALAKRPYGIISDQPLRARALRDETGP